MSRPPLTLSLFFREPVATIKCDPGGPGDRLFWWSDVKATMALLARLTVFALLSIVFANALPKSYHEDDGGESGADRGGHGDGHGHAHSFHHFSGPVEGHHEEISWKDKHGDHYHDYRAHPKYKFAYGVDDKHTKDHHGQSEHRDGKEVEGEYHIHEPGGNVRTVKYHADPHGGFFAEVHNYGGNDHSGGTYGHKH
ncbi:cuticular protein 11 [Calliopsis andreniformis]|uniref:cuticular protein 11 n=1 Tax=Calliopsis andreniformis TaxID=337506 RepID=UPI003FCDBCEE